MAYYAGFWRRFFAWIVDGIILNIVGWILGFVFSGLPGGVAIAFSYIFFIASIVYYIGFWVWRGATPGKMLLGVEIIGKDGQNIGIGRAILRFIGYYISAIILFIGYLMIAFDKNKQGLHDKIAGTFVRLT